MGREARLLRYPHRPRTRDPRALSLRKQVGHAAHMPGAKWHLATLHHPHGTEAQAADPRLPLQALPGLCVPPGDCTFVAALALLREPSPGCLQQPARAGPPSRRGAGLLPHWTEEEAGVGLGNWRAGHPRASYPTLDRGGLGQHGDGPCQPPCSLLRGLASSHLPASGSPGPLVSAFWGPVLLAGGHLGCRLLRELLLGPAAPLLPVCQTLLLLLGG